MRILLFIFFFFCSLGYSQSTSEPKVRQVRYDAKTTTEMNAITRVQEGSTVYNTDTGTKWVHNGAVWVDQGAAGGTDNQVASEVPFTSYLTITQPNLQLALEEMKDELDLLSGDNLGSDADRGDFTVASGVATIDNDAITNIKMAPDAVSSTKIIDGGVSEVDLKAVNSPTDEYVLTYETTTGDFEWQSQAAADNLGADGDKGDITVGGTGTTLEIDADAVGSAEIANLSIAGVDLGVDSVDEGKIADDAIQEEHLKSVNSPTDEYFLTYESTTGDFEWVANAGGADQLGDDADRGDITVGGTGTTLSIDAGVVDATHIATDAVTGDEIATDAVDTDEIATDAVTSDEIADEGVSEIDLKVVNAPTDEYVLTYESTTGDFEWQVGAGSSGHTIEDEGTPLTARSNLNIVGVGVDATDDVGNDATIITIDELKSLTQAAYDALSAPEKAAFTGIITATTGNAITAANVENVPSGNLVATDVQAALDEIQTEVDGISAGGDGLGPDGDKGDITVGGTGTTLSIDATAVDGTHIANNAVQAVHIADNNVGEADLNVTNAGTDDYVLTYNAAGSNFTWVDDSTLGAGADGLGSDGDKGDITVGGTGTTLTINDPGAGLSGSPAVNDFAQFVNGTDIQGRSYAETRSDLGLVIGTDVQAHIEIIVSSGDVDDVNTALASAGSTPVRITADITGLDTPILMESDQTLIMEGQTINVSNSITGGAVIKNTNADGTDRNITIIGGTIDGSAATSAIYDAILLDSVTVGRIENVIAMDVEITASGTATGNFHLVQSDSILVKNVEAYDTWRMGIYVEQGVANVIDGGYFNGTHDSGIGAVDSDYMTIKNVMVDSCGTSDASNITANMRNGLFMHNTSINAPGTNNGNGFTLGHSGGYDAYNTLVIGNVFEGNVAKGIYLQGTNTDGNVISNNIITNNGVGSGGANSGGISIASGSMNKFTNNTVKGNKHGVSIVNGSVGNIISNNTIEDSTVGYGIKNDGQETIIKDNYFDGNFILPIYQNTNASDWYISGNNVTSLDYDGGFIVENIPSTSTNRASNSAIRMTRELQANNTELGIWLPTSRTDLYGAKLRTERLTGGTDFQTVFSNHKGTEAGVDALTIDDAGNVDVAGNITVGGTVDGIDIATDVAANTAKDTNATHTGDVTGSTALTIATGVVGTDEVQNSSITEIDLDFNASPTDGYLVAYDLASLGFRYTNPSTINATHTGDATGSGALTVIDAIRAAEVISTATVTMNGHKMYNDQTADAGTLTLSDCDAGETLLVYINRASAPTLAGAGLTYNALPNTTAFAAATQMGIFFQVAYDGTTIDYYYFER